MKVAHTRMIRFTISCALSIIVLSLFFGFIFMHSYNNSFLYLGGYHGYYATLWLNAWIGPWGTALFIIALVIILLVHLSYKTIEYIRRVSSVNLTGKAIQAIKNRTDNPETDNENDNKETESNETQNTENIPSSENNIVNTLPEYLHSKIYKKIFFLSKRRLNELPSRPVTPTLSSKRLRPKY